MKQGWLILILIVSSVPVFAGQSKDCSEIKSEQIRLAMLGSNIANINTTRTPESAAHIVHSKLSHVPTVAVM